LKLKSNRGRVQTALLIYLLFCVALDFAVWIWFMLHRHTPGHFFPLGERMERFGDLLRFSAKYQVGTYSFLHSNAQLFGTLFPKNYPPFGVVIYLFLLQACSPYALPVLLASVLGAVAVACALLWRRVRHLESYRWYIGVAIFATGLFGWGTLQVVMRGNIEGLLWVAVSLGAALFARRSYRSSAVAFAIASCIKPYPMLWFALMARHRRYREVALGLVSAAALTLASLLIIDRNPLRAWRYITGRSTFFQDYIVAFRPFGEMTGDHSLFQSIKTIARVVHNHGFNFPPIESTVQSNDPLAWTLYKLYLPLAALIALVVLWRVWNKPVLNQVFALACITMVLPMVAGDYTLVLLLVPMGFFLIFLLEDVAQGKAPLSIAKILCFLLPCTWIMATEPLVTLHGVLKCIALLCLLAASIAIPLPSTLFGETSSEEGEAVALASVQSSQTSKLVGDSRD
jgi:hypothetical protein